MKALLYILLGPIIIFGGLYLAWLSHVHAQGLGVVAGIFISIIGSIVLLTGLARNHRDHTRR